MHAIEIFALLSIGTSFGFILGGIFAGARE